LSSAFHISASAFFLGGIGQRVEHVADLVPPAPLLAGLGEHLADRGPEPQGTVADREHRTARLVWLGLVVDYLAIRDQYRYSV